MAVEQRAGFSEQCEQILAHDVGKRRTPNVQRPTLNSEAHWTLNVERRALSVDFGTLVMIIDVTPMYRLQLRLRLRLRRLR